MQDDENSDDRGVSSETGGQPLAPSVLVAEANHRITNNLALIVGLLRMHAGDIRRRPRQMSATEVSQLLDDVGARIQTVAALHRLLSADPRHLDVDIGGYLREVCATLTSTFAYRGGIDLSALEPGCVVSSGKAVPLALIVGELVTNAIKHAHPTGLAGDIAILARCEQDGSVVVEVSDDGVGLPEGLDPLAEGGIGLRLVRTLGEQLQAMLEFASSSVGLRVCLRVPAR